jgi:hypothetical protein
MLYGKLMFFGVNLFTKTKVIKAAAIKYHLKDSRLVVITTSGLFLSPREPTITPAQNKSIFQNNKTTTPIAIYFLVAIHGVISCYNVFSNAVFSPFFKPS